MLEAALKECAELRASLIRRAADDKDALAVATAFAFEAMRIWREMGGEKHVAGQLYNLADDAATKT